MAKSTEIYERLTALEVTSVDMKSDIKHIREMTEAILEQTRITNGRVTKLEVDMEKSTGLWVHRNPIKFAFIVTFLVLLMISIFIYEVRHAMFNMLGNIIRFI